MSAFELKIISDQASANPPSEPPQAAVLELITGKWASQAVYAAAELGIPDLLAQGERDLEDLARATGTRPDLLYRLLRALDSLDVLAEGAGRRFRNTPLGETLRSDTPGSLRGFARLAGMEMSWRGWGELVNSLKTGVCAFEHVAGEPTFKYLGTRPYEAQIVNSAMTSMSELESQSVVDAYDFSHARSVVDVGGGHGLLLATVLEANPGVRGVLFELPHAADGARQLFAERGLSDRTEVIAGNALEAAPEGGDVYLLKHIVHDWDDAHSIRFLSNIAAVLGPDGRVLLIEMVLTPPRTPHFSKLLDLEMLVMSPGGRERTLAEYERLFAAAGLSLDGVYPTAGANTVIAGRKI